jgi:hypothetical protein
MVKLIIKQPTKIRKVKLIIKEPNPQMVCGISIETITEIVENGLKQNQGWFEGSQEARDYMVEKMTLVRIDQLKSIENKVNRLLDKLKF